MPVISVIVPVYKISLYLSSCIDSILTQTFYDLEIILVDDGSPDTCGVICDNYSAVDKRIRVIHQKNRGLSCARNTGVVFAEGEFICFVDGDDLIAPEYCETLISMLKGSDHSFSACGVKRFADGTIPSLPNEKDVYKILTSREYLQEQLDKKAEFGVWNKLFHREIFDYLRFIPGKIHEDVIFSTDLAKRNGTAILTSRKMYYYRQRDTGIVAEGEKRCSPDRVFAGEYLITTSKTYFPDLYKKCLNYAIDYPWMFVDKIYVDRDFGNNSEFLNAIQEMIRKHLNEWDNSDRIKEYRIRLFAKSRFIYGVNAYSRLLRVYVYHLIGKDAYSDGHGI